MTEMLQALSSKSWERLLEAARGGRIAIMTTGQPRKGLLAALQSSLGAARIQVLSGANLLPPTLGVEGKTPEETLRWIAAGELYEELVRQKDKLALVVCLDPWAACQLSPGQNPRPEAAWAFVSDVRSRQAGEAKEYWQDMEDWIGRLAFDCIVDAETMLRTRKPAAQYELTDRAAFRNVFADPSEKFVLALAQDGQIPDLAEAAKQLPDSRWTVFGAAVDGMHSLGAGHRALLPAIVSVADTVVLPAEARLPDDCSSSKAVRLGARADGNTPAVRTKDFVLFNDWGIGDELLLSAVAREIVKAHPSTRVWIRSRYGFSFRDYARGEGRPPFRAQWVETIYQNPVLYGPQHHSPFPGHLVQQMLDKVCLDTGLKVLATDVRPELALPARAQDGGAVVVHAKPNPRLPSKDWGVERWERLCEILHAEGVRLRQVGESGDPMLPYAEDLRGLAVGELPAVVSGAGAVVCLVGFLMHLAEATRTPAVVIYGGREHPAIDGYADQVHLSSGPLACRGRWGCHLAPDLACPYGMKCMEKITPELVTGETLKLLGASRKARAS